MKITEVAFKLISLLPFWVLHRFSDLTFVFIYYFLGYRKKVVWENLKGSFPEKNDRELKQLQKRFYRNFCDLIFETLKTFTISKDELKRRCFLENPEILVKLYEEKKSVVGISSHLGNWEWLSLAFSLSLSHTFFAVYKPLSQRKLNHLMLKSRERFGGKFTPIKALKSVLEGIHSNPFVIGLLSDQSPHDFSKAFQFSFLHRPTYFVPGPGVICAHRGLTPIYGWVRRIGRSRYVWHLELLPEEELQKRDFDAGSLEQIQKISRIHDLNEPDAIRAFLITRYYVRRLEAEIKMAPQDWLWSHRRWKIRKR